VDGRWGLSFFIAGTALAALGVAAASLRFVDLRAVAVVFLAVLVTEAFASHFREQVTVSLSNIVILVAILLGGTPLAAVGALGALPVFLVKASDRRMQRTAFNSGQYVLTAAAGGAIYSGLTYVSGSVFPSALSLVAIFAAAVTYSVVNHALVAVAVSLSSTEKFFGAFKSVGPSIALQAPYAGIAVLAAVILLRASPWALLLMAVPTLIARYGLLAFQRLDESYDRLVRSFVKAIEIKDLYTRGHSERVAELSVHVAEELGVPYDERRLTRYAALLHDVGKIGVPLCIINKPGPLDDDEFEAIKQHPSIGADILHDIDFLAPAIDIVRYHHERLDGRGYPHGVGEEELSDIVRIVTAVDAFDAMTSTRSYRRALAVEDAVAELRRCAGRQFDPRMVEALAAVVERIGWEPTIEFASERHLHGEDIPIGTAQERLGQDPSEVRTASPAAQHEASEVRP
jgi:putative nucleotidyltransferase with HDIG domain